MKQVLGGRLTLQSAAHELSQEGVERGEVSTRSCLDPKSMLKIIAFWAVFKRFPKIRGPDIKPVARVTRNMGLQRGSFTHPLLQYRPPHSRARITSTSTEIPTVSVLWCLVPSFERMPSTSMQPSAQTDKVPPFGGPDFPRQALIFPKIMGC